MAKYRVKRSWFGVTKGQIIETDNLHQALRSNVEPADDQEVDTDSDAMRTAVIAKLTELKIKHNKKAETGELAALLPEEVLNELIDSL